VPVDHSVSLFVEIVRPSASEPWTRTDVVSFPFDRVVSLELADVAGD
jgi:hypothetical protein